MGLQVSGPCYQPGHKTYLFLRVHNMTSQNIPLYQGQGIAQIMFDYLSIEPEIPYSKDTNNSYQNENDYKGVLGDWQKTWLEQVQNYDHKIDKLEDLENRIYGNILTLMGIFISIFSLLSFNFNAISSQIDIISLLRMDFSLTLLVYILIGAITIIVNKHRGKAFYIVYFIILTILLGANILLWLTNF